MTAKFKVTNSGQRDGHEVRIYNRIYNDIYLLLFIFTIIFLNSERLLISIEFLGDNKILKKYHQTDTKKVPQLYVGFPAAANEPPKQLKGFDRVFITKGATVGVTLNLSPLEFAVWNVAKQQWEHVPGTYKIFIGQHSRSEELTATIDI